MLIGIEKIKAVKTGLSFHHSHTNCEFNWNHTNVCPAMNSSVPHSSGLLINYFFSLANRKEVVPSAFILIKAPVVFAIIYIIFMIGNI